MSVVLVSRSPTRQSTRTLREGCNNSLVSSHVTMKFELYIFDFHVGSGR